MPLTRQDIDALWDAHRKRISGSVAMNREEAYLSAGLTAEGERKPERVRCWLHEMGGRKTVYQGDPDHAQYPDCRITPGWFVPDGAE